MSQIRDLTQSAALARIATIAFVAMQWGFAAFLLWDNSVYRAYLANENGADEIAALTRLDTLNLPVSIVFLVVIVVAYIINGRWIYRASSNAAIRVPSAERISPGWAVGWYAVPIANLWKPYTAMKQIWAASVGGGKLESPTPPWFTIWWLSWIALGIFDGVVSNIGNSSFATPEDYMNSNFYTAISGFLWIVPSILFLRLVNEITAAQHNDADVFS